MKTKMKFSKQILSVLLCLAMLISYVPVFSLTASAATVDVWDGTTASQAWDSGSGTEADPYIIMTAAQLAKLVADVNSGTDYSGTYFKLGADLDLGGSDRTWTPIGDATYTFKGNFNGDGKTISNMYAYGKNTNNKTYGYRALFGNITGGTIENFTLASPSSTGAWGYIAAAVAYGSGATVKNIIITNPKVTTQAKSSKGFAGGVVGHIADGVIENCKIVSGTIDSKFKCTGGVVGYATDAQISGCSVKDVTISSTSQYVGGIVGQLQYTDGINSIENCTVENCAISSTSSAVGGVVGYAYGNSAGIITVKRCSVTGGSVTASNYAGGIMGQSFNADIIGCCNYGASVTATSSTGYAGGILGYYNIGNCYSCFSSAVITASKYPGAIIGGDSTYYYECAYDKTLYAQNKTYSNTKGFTTEEIKDGAAAYHLANTGTREKNFHNWGQKIGTDLYPVWNTNNDSSIVVYREEGSNGYIYFNEGTVDVFEPNEDGYYEISDTETWYKFARKAEEDASVKGLVTAAIDFSAISADAIEDYRICADVAFTGTFDGGNKTISGLPETDKPLFGTIGVGGKLLNMTLSGATVTSRYDTAGLVLENNGKVENCTVSNVTVSGSIVSGMIGENNGTISNCTAENVTVSSTSSSAGLVSYNTGTIEDCAVVSGTITADSTSKGNTYDAWAGGICGISIGGKISGCSNGANVIAKSGDNHAAAGIVAAPSKDSSGNSVQVTECFNTGAISSDYYAGGITGFYETSVYVSISLCYNTGNIEGTTVGGIAASGSNNRNDKFINCYNAGQVNGSKAGGIAGSRGNVIIQNCHNYAKVVSTNIGAPIVGMDSGAWPGTGNLINNHAIEGNVEAPTVRSFYDTATATSSSNAVIKGSTKEQFESGEIAYLLQQANGGAAVWSQGESYPVFASDENDKVVKIDFYAVIDEIVHENSYATIYLIPGRVLTEADYPSPSDIGCTLEGCYLDRDCTMAIDRTAFTADTDTKLFVKLITHRHDWTYTKENETTITATCIADGCTAKDGGSVKLVAPTELTYNGTAKEATLQFDNWQLGDDAKPTISYNDTDKVAVTNKDIVATITLGVESASVTYKVKPASISGATVTADTVNYTGNAQTPDVSVVLNGKTLVKDTDYTVSYNNNTNAGTATVTVTGTGNYEGTATGTFTITDTAEPTGAILIKDNTWLQFLNNITFGLFFKENVDVIVTADGTGSAVDKVEYLFSSTELNKNNLPADGWKTVKGNNGTYTFAITARNKGAVYVKITDAYGNVAVINSDGIVVYTDSKVAEDTVYFTYQSTEDAVIDLELNGNTVKNVLFNGHEITNYWSVGGNKLTLDADYLGRLVVLDNGAGYPVTVYFNPLGVETEKVELKDEFTLVIQKADGSVTNISNIGKTYDGTSVSEPTFDKLGDGMATIEYKVKGAEDSTYTTEVPKNAGDYVVRVSVAEGTNYNEAYGTAEFKIEKADAEIDDNPAAINGLIYNGDPQALVSAGSTEDGIIKYSLDGVVYSTNIPKGTNAGTYSVYVRIVGDENHNNSDLMPVEVKIDKATVTEPTIASKPYTGSAQTADIVDTDLYTVEQNNGGTAQGSYDVVLKLKDADNYKWATTDNAEVTVKFVISAAENAWKVAPSISGWTYGENAKAPTYEAKFGTVKVTYTGKANDGSDYNSETAPTKAGNYTATFTVEGTADYSGLSESVDFTIAKATYDMSSAKWNYINAFKYDGKEHKVEVVGLPEGVTIGGYNGNTATVVGDYTAKVTLTYDANNYNAPSVADLNWKVENNWTPSEYTVNGDGWMNQDFVITANDGYKVSLNSIANGEWKDALTYSAETDNGSVTFYLKNETDGTISLAKTVTYKLDKTAPTGTVEFVDRTGWQEFVNTITFGLFYKDDVTVKITGADNLSGVAKVEYYVSDEALTLDQVKTITDWTDYSDSFGVSVEDTKKFVYYVRITDNAGNVTYISTDGAEYDITAPVISGIENGNTYYTTQKVTVTDKNLDTVTLNGNAVTETVTLDGDKDVTYTIVATDKAGNSTTVTVTMKPISDLSVPIDALNKDNVNGGDEQTVDGVKAAVATVDTTNATDEEKAALKEIADEANELEKVIDDTKAEITRIEEELNKHDDATVNSDDTAALEQLAKDIKELLDGDNLTDAERTALTEDAGKVEDMQKTVADTTAENKRISDAVDGYDLATVTSDDKADLEQLLADIEKQLESTNLTEEEISELNGDKKAVEDLLTKIKGTDELIDKLIEDVNEYGDETVKSTDKDAIEQIIEDIDALLETENLTEDEKKDLEDAKDKAEGLLETIDGADKATDTENTEKVKDVTSENVTPEDKTDLEKAKADLEKALEDYGNNYTDDEKKAIEDEIKRIDDALEVIENVENVEELIGKIPENITKNDEAAIKAADDAYNALTDYEKSLVDEDAKKALDDAKAALAELNKPTDPNSPQTGDNSNLWLWFALLFVSGAGVFGITLNERKRRTANKR